MRMPSLFQTSYSISALSKSALVLCLAVAALSGCSWNPWKSTDPTPGAAGNAGAGTDANARVQATTKSRFVRFFSPYKIDIQQGNFVSAEMLAQLKEGM